MILVNLKETESKMSTDKRATLQIRIAINRVLKNKNSINTTIAKLISQFSHRSVLRIASKFESVYPSEYYIISKVHSPFWATTVNMPSRVVFNQNEALRGTNFGTLSFAPDWNKASCFHKKKIFDPFGHPYIKKRHRKFHLTRPLSLDWLS